MARCLCALGDESGTALGHMPMDRIRGHLVIVPSNILRGLLVQAASSWMDRMSRPE